MNAGLRWISLALVAAALSVSALLADESAAPLTPAEAKAVLEAGGFKVSTLGVSLPDEAEFAKGMKEMIVHRKALFAAERELQAAEQELNRVKQTITTLKAQHVELSAGLTGSLTITQNNRIVGALNAISGQIDLLLEQQNRSTDKVKAARGKVNDAREAYVEQVLTLRTLADRITQHWEKAAADPEQQRAIEKASEVLKKSLELKPSAAFARDERTLKSIEENVLSESIKLRNENDTLYVTCVINGKHTQELIVDSGATSVSLPFTLAKEMGIEPNSSDEKVVVSLADGSQVPGTRKVLDSVRVGKFTVEKVECIILDPIAVRAPALLGMSFLGHFKFELDAQKGELKMVKVETEESKKGK